MSRHNADEAAKRIMVMAKVIAQKPEGQRRIMLRPQDLKLLKDFPDEPSVTILRDYCRMNLIKFASAKRH